MTRYAPPLLAVLLVFSFGLSASAATYYIDYASGNDSNPGISQTAPWKHAPGMQGCTARCAAAAPRAGDSILFKGGATWPNAAFPMAWQWSGSSSSNIYIGVDPTWFTGSSWTRPIFDAQGSAIAGANNMFVDLTGQQYVTLDNIEMKGFFWSGNPAYARCQYIGTYSGQNFLLNHLYLHGWTHAAGAFDGCTIVLGDTNSPYVAGSVFQNGVIDGSDGSSDSMGAFYCFPSVKNSVIHDLSNGILPCGHGEISGNLVYNINRSVSSPSVHENFLETLIADSNGTFYIHDNVFHDGIGEAAFLGNPNETDYVWNNIWYNLRENAPELVQNQQAGVAAYFYNNTIVPQSGAYCLRQGHDALTGTVVFQNNHCITSVSPGTDPLLSAGTLTISHNVFQAPSAASGQGFTSAGAYAYSPASASSAVAGVGVNLSSRCSGALAGLCSDTDYACSVDAKHQVSCPARTALPRAGGSAAWEAGAFEFSASAGKSTPPSPPTNLSITVQ
jgi:hypothetical protein